MINFRIKLAMLIMRMAISILPSGWDDKAAIQNLIRVYAIGNEFNWMRFLVIITAWIVIILLWYFTVFATHQ